MNKKKFFSHLLLCVILIIIITITIICCFKNNKKWHENNPFIAHALYGIENIDYTNSYESLELGYIKGLKIFEADFLLTSDEQVILTHHWENNEPLSHQEFMSKKIHDKYTPLDLEDLLLYMKKHKDIYVVIDTKQNMFDLSKHFDVYSKIVDETRKIDSKLLNRFIVQIYDYDEFEKIKNIYNFKDYIFTIYKLEDFSLPELTSFCVANSIDTIVFPHEYIYNRILNRHDIKFIKEQNLKVYTHTVNDKSLYDYYTLNGIDGIFTDSLY